MNICSATKINYLQAQNYAKSKNATSIFINNAKIYWELCTKIGINPCIAYCQYALESGWGKFGGVLNESYCNPCGLKNTSGGSCTDANAHKKFSSWEKGISAHIDHLALYAGVKGYPKTKTEDPRHFPYLFGKVKTVEGLTNTWAMSSTYANNLLKLINELEKYNSTSSLNLNNNGKTNNSTSNNEFLSGSGFKIRVKINNLNIRKSSSFDSKVLGTVKKGQVFTIIKVVNGLGQLKSGVGWISMHKNYVEKITTNNISSNGNYKIRIVNCSYVNARKGPSTSYSVGQIIKSGTILVVIGETKDGWLKIQSGLYIYKDYTRKI